MSVIDDLLEAKEPELRECTFCLVHELREEWAEAKKRHSVAEARAIGPRKDAEAAAELETAVELLEELRARIGEHLAVFKFKSVDREVFDQLKRECRPTEQQKTEARKLGMAAPEWDIDTFSPALVAAACTEVITPSGSAPGLQREQADAIWKSDRWNQAERAELFHTALGAYISRTDMDGVALGKGSVKTRSS